MTAPSIAIKSANLNYQCQTLFSNLSLTVSGGEWTCLLGPSGVGKTSLLRLIAGLATDATSQVITASDAQPIAGRIAYLTQHDSLLPWLTLQENILIGTRLRGENIGAKEQEKAQQLLVRVGLQHATQAFPHELSGGMKQRAMLARTIFENKSIVLLDEPFGSLDIITRTSIQELAADLLQKCTVLLVTHDPLEALRLGHHIYIMAGKPAEIGSQIRLPGQPPRGLLDEALIHTQAMLLEQLSHAKGVTEC